VDLPVYSPSQIRPPLLPLIGFQRKPPRLAARGFSYALDFMLSIYKRLLWLGLLLGSLAVVYLLYRPALSGSFMFDDWPNLSGLKGLDDGNVDQVLAFVFPPIKSGPLGRPIAYASFVFQAANWPSDPEAFLYCNVLIHLINGLLVAWLALRLHRLLPNLTSSAEGFAVSLATLWMVQPLLASSSLMVIQRMTTLSATLMLAGMIAYLVGRERLTQAHRSGWLLMVAGMGLATILAMFTKETGALLPLYLWVLEVTLLKDVSPSQALRYWRGLLALPLLLLCAYWIMHWDALEAGAQRRPFTLVERLLTEPRILAQYVFLLFFPIRSQFGPFHDDYRISHSLLSPPSTIVCIVGWVLLIVLSVVKRKDWPLLAFSVGWFLVGHLLESTLFPLELYFEHRNYLAALGALASLCILLWRLPPSGRVLGGAVFGVYLVLNAFILHELTQVWGSSRLAAQLWLDQHPGSERARQQLAQQYLMADDEPKALKTIKEGYQFNPQLTRLALQTLQMSCFRGDDTTEMVKEMLPNLATGTTSFAALDALQRISNNLPKKSCKGMDEDVLLRILDTLMANPKYQVDLLSMADLHRLKAQQYANAGDLDLCVRNLDASFQAEPNIDIALLAVAYLSSAGLDDAALQKIVEFRSAAPVNPVLKRQWDKKLDEAQAAISGKSKSKSVAK